MLQCVLQSVHQVVVMRVEELLDDLAAEHAPLVDIDQLSDLQPANRVLRRQEQHNDTLRIIRYKPSSYTRDREVKKLQDD